MAAPKDALEHLEYYFAPFYNECRAYGRLVDANLNGKVAVRCHGYMTLPAHYEDELRHRFGVFIWERPSEESELPVSERQELQAVVKELILEDTIWIPRVVRKRLGDLKKVLKKQIYVRDIKPDNYVGGLLVDFSIAWTEPHFIFDIKPPYWTRVETTRDLEQFDDMVVKDLKIKTTVRATPNREYLRRLRSYQTRKRLAQGRR